MVAFQTEIYSMCRFNTPNIREGSDMGSSAFSRNCKSLAVINKALESDFMLCFGDIMRL